MWQTLMGFAGMVFACYQIEKIAFQTSKRDGIAAYRAADRLAEERMASIKRSRGTFLRNERHILNRGTRKII